MVILPLSPQERIRNDFLKSEYEKGGIPVFEVTYLQWKKRFYQLTNEDYDEPQEFMGVYHNDPSQNRRFDLPDRFILINKAMNNSWRLAVYYHELGHHACTKARCPCAKHGFVFRKTELHAELAAIYLATQRGFPQMTFNMLVEAVLDLDHPKQNRVWNATRMVKHPVFIEAKNFVGKPFTDWLTEKKQLRQREKYFNAIVDDSTRMCRWHPSALLRTFAKDTV